MEAEYIFPTDSKLPVGPARERVIRCRFCKYCSPPLVDNMRQHACTRRNGVYFKVWPWSFCSFGKPRDAS